MRIPKEEYKKVIEILERYNYNRLNIIQRQSDILSLSLGGNNEGRAKYSISDSTLSKVLRLESDKSLQKSINEFKIVNRVLALVKKETNEVFEKIFVERKTKWEAIDELHLSEGTYKRRKNELIYTTYKEMKND